jgi:hypothetical protein
VVLSLAPEDLLLLLCVHGGKHCWCQLNWICDVAELLRAHPELDWDQVLEQARTRGGMRMLLLGLRLARDLLEAPVPDEVSEKIAADRKLEWLSGKAWKWLFGDTPCSSKYEMWSFYLAMRERWRDRARYYLYLAYLAVTPTATDQAMVSLPRSVSALYYLTRPFRLAGQIAWAPLKRFFLTRSVRLNGTD